MYRTVIFCLLALLFIHPAQSSELEVVSNGLDAEEVFLSIDSIEVEDDHFGLGTRVYVNFVGISGLSIKDDLVFIGASMELTDKNGVALLSYEDLFSSYENGIAVADANELNVNLIIGDPMEINQSYTWRVRIWDKIGSGDITTNMEFRVTGILYEEKGLKPAELFLSRGDQFITSYGVNYGDTLYFNFHDIEGFETLNERVYPGASLQVINSEGVSIMDYTDLFKSYESEGVRPEAARYLNLSLLVGDPLRSGENYTWKVRVWDKTSDRRIDSEVMISVR